jgi:hypothetical protein
MKTLHLYRIVACAALVAAFSYGFASVGLADDVVVHHDAWSHDGHGYYDGHQGYHAFVSHENHHGYWRDRNDGTRVFINID